MIKEDWKNCNLITQDVLSCLDFWETAPNSKINPEKPGFEEQGKRGLTWKEYAWESAVNKLSRIYGDFPLAAKRGIEFEKVVYQSANKVEPKGSDFFLSVVNDVKGMNFGNKGGINIQIPGVDDPCFIYTKEDALKLPRILDLKTTGSLKKGKYLEGWQHKLYLYRWLKEGKSVDEFMYVIAEWLEYPKIKQVHREVFLNEKAPNLKQRLEEVNNYPSFKLETFDPDSLMLEVELKIKNFLNRLTDMDVQLFDTYKSKYCLYDINKTAKVYECEEQKTIDDECGF